MASPQIYDRISQNRWKTVLLFLIFFAIVIGLGYLFGFYYGSPFTGLSLAGIFLIIYGLIGYYAGDSMILAMSRAKEVTHDQDPYLYNTVEGLAIAAQIPMPKIYMIDDITMNAFATGRDPKHASITVTRGIREKMNRLELEGVVAHEMSHIKNYDIRVMMLAVVLVGVITLLSDFMLRSFFYSSGGRRDSNKGGGGIQIVLIIIGVVLAALAPLFAQLVKLAISRRREYLADADAAMLTRYPAGLASALKKIKDDPDPVIEVANKSTAHLFIANPLGRKQSAWLNLFQTHPPIDERIKILESM